MYVFERAPSQTPVSTPNPASTHRSSNITYPVRTQNEKKVNRHPDVLVWNRRSLHTRTYRFARTFHYTFWCSVLAACLAYSYRFFLCSFIFFSAPFFCTVSRHILLYLAVAIIGIVQESRGENVSAGVCRPIGISKVGEEGVAFVVWTGYVVVAF